MNLRFQMVPAALAARKGSSGDWVCLECEEIFTVDSDAQITAEAPMRTVTGPVAVAVTTSPGEGTGQQFTYS
jgi:hypothetical protein